MPNEDLFQSPCGEAVMKGATRQQARGFASDLKVSVPLRGSGDERVTVFKLKIDTPTVSVPLRGSGDERLSGSSASATQSQGVSVPLRGSGDESLSILEEILMSVRKGFQSPCGEAVMKELRKEHLMTNLDSLFQSPCGEAVMKGCSCGIDAI